MPSLITSEETDCFTGQMSDLFDTFKRPIIVFKDPKKVVTAGNVNDQNVYFGYRGRATAPSVITSFDVQSGTFDAVITYDDEQESKSLEDINTHSRNGECRIKVREPAREYINNGKTENIQFDGKVFNVVGDESVKDFFGFKLYVYHLEATR